MDDHADPDTPFDLEARAGYVIKRLHIALAAVMDAAVAPMGLTATQFAALTLLRQHGSLSGTALARLIGSSEQAVSTLAERVIARGFVTRSPHPSDRRKSLLAVTAAGRHAWQIAAQAADQAESNALAGLTPAQQVQLRTLALEATRAVEGALVATGADQPRDPAANPVGHK